jgi:predicted nucleic acid-binding protein
LVWHLRGNKKARDVIHKSIPFSISVVTYIELVQGMRDKKEMNGLMKQLSRWDVEIIQINENISTRAMIYVEQYFHSSSIQMADALIAATCVNNSDILLTGNEKHYKNVQNIQMKYFRPR